MSFLDSLCATKATPSAAWLEFTQLAVRKRESIFLFVEGRLDMAFYPAMARRYLGSDCDPIPLKCGNREAVLSVRLRIHGLHPAADRCLYFVDKDYTDIHGAETEREERLFVTEVHSVENYLVTREAVQIVWTEVWGLSLSDPALEAIGGAFEEGFRRLSVGLRPVTAWILLALRGNGRPCLADVRLEGLMTVSGAGLPARRRDCLLRLKEDTRCLARIPFTDLLRETRCLRARPAHEWLRGKFAFAWFCRFIDHVRETIQGIPRSSIASVDVLGPLLASKVPGSARLRRFFEEETRGA
jgi:hypothetical protein